MKDVIIVGAGPIGICCAIACEKENLDYVVLEKGCLVNSLFNFPRNMTFFSTSKLLEIGGVPFISHHDKPSRGEALEYYRRVVEKWDLNISYYEQVDRVNNQEDGFEVVTAQRTLKSRFVVVATGFYDRFKSLGVPGEGLPKVSHYYTEVHPYIGQKVVVIGAANSACDVALELFHKGSDVTMVVRGSSINSRVKYWIKPNIENRIKEGSIKSYFNAEVSKIEEKSVTIIENGREVTLENDFVLAMTGYEPNFQWFHDMGIPLDPEDDKLLAIDPDTLESNLPNLFCAGVLVAGKYTSKLFIENSRVHADIIIGEIVRRMGDKRKLRAVV